MVPIGKTAYDAYRESLAKESPEDLARFLSHEKWEDLDPVQQRAWAAAEMAVDGTDYS